MLDTLAAASAGATDIIAAPAFLDPQRIIESAGPWMLAVVALIVFIESGVLFPFLPGDSLLFVAGLMSPAMGVPLWQLIPVIWIAAICGDQVGYFLGYRFGRRLFKDDARVLSTAHLRQAEEFFVKHGGKSLFLARFVPIVRTFVPLAAGVAHYKYRKFILWNVAGGLTWGFVLPLAGYYLGTFDIIREHVDLWVLVIIGLSLIPVAIEVIRERRAYKKEQAAREAAGSAEGQDVESEERGA